MKVIYMGTPEFAVEALRAIAGHGHKILAVFTQPDKAKGRSKALIPTPVKSAATELGIKVYQPEKIREEENVCLIRNMSPDIIVVAAYGQILPESILGIPRYGCVNIHASLLPKYRGAAPIEWAIIDGEEKTGVTTMYMAKGLDTGDMIAKKEVMIEPDDTGETLHDKLKAVGAELILSTMDSIEAGTAVRMAQDSSLSCYASMLTKELGNMDFEKSATELERLIRGLIPWPCAYTRLDGRLLKIYKASVKEMDTSGYKAGEIAEITKKSFTIACGVNGLEVTRLQPEGRKVMDAAAFLNGNKIKCGMICERV